MITLAKATLLKPLLDAMPAISQRSPLPVLACANIELLDGTMQVIGTDLQTQITATAQTEDAGAIHVLLDAHKLASVLKLLPDGDVKLDEKQGFMTLSSGRSRYKFATLDHASFPAFDHSVETGRVVTDCSDFRRLLSSVAPFMGKTDVRSYLNGLYVEVDADGLRVTASDGHRLAINEAICTDGAAFAGIIPRDAVTQLLKTLPKEGELTIVARHNTMEFSAKGLSLSTKLIEGRYPDVRRIIPHEHIAEMLVEAGVLSSALQRAMLAAGDRQGVGMELQGKELLIKSSAGEEAADEVVGLDSADADDKVSFGYNGNYIIDALSGADKGVYVRIASNGAMSITCGTNYFALIMPMRL
jgi:DNA polymerase-3 subunit beta